MTELTVFDRAEQALAFSDTRAKLAELATKSHRIVEITNSAGYQECQAAQMALRSTRVEIEKRGKAAREDSTAFSKAVIAKEKELIGLIEPEENRLAALRDEIDRAKELEKQRKEEAERQRVAAINARFDAIRNLPVRGMGQLIPDIEILIAEAEAVDPLTFPEDLQPAVVFEKRKAIAGLRAVMDAEVAAIAERKKILAEREELAKLRAEQEANRQAEEERRQREREQQERDDNERRKKADEEARAERERLAAEQAVQARERLAAENLLREQRAKEQAERDAAEAAERQRLKEAADKLAAERAEFQRQQAQAAKEAQAKAIAGASLIEAAREALPLLQANFPEHVATLKLAAAIERAAKKSKAEAA